VIDFAPTVLGVLALAGLAQLFILNPFDKSLTNRLLGSAIVIVGLTPGILWARAPARNPVPLMAIVGMLQAVCFGIAGFVTPLRYIGAIKVQEEAYTPALLASLTSLLCLYTGFWLVGPLVKKELRFKGEQNGALDTFVLYKLFPPIAILHLGIRFLHIGALNNISECFNTIIICWVAYALFKGRYGGVAAILASCVVLPYEAFFVLDILGGYLWGLIKLSVIFGLSFTAARGKVPVLGLILVAALGLFLNQGKTQYRVATWNQAEKISPLDAAAKFIELSSKASDINKERGFWNNVHDTYTRYNFLHVTAAVMDVTPSMHPYLGGSSYVPLLTKWIPRFIWKDKPVELLGNSWARAYGYLDAGDLQTSFNLPWLPEMYMNFGWMGVILISSALGGALSILWRLFAYEADTTERFATGLAICSPLLVPQESNLSLSVGTVIITIACVYVFRLALAWAPTE
jgi:hypothetical protein